MENYNDKWIMDSVTPQSEHSAPSTDVSHMHAYAMHCDTWLAMCHHMVHHVSLDTRFLEIREIPTISEFNEIRLGS